MRLTIGFLITCLILSGQCIRPDSLTGDVVPDGITNARDLGNGRFPGVPPLRWNSDRGRTLRDILVWIDADNPMPSNKLCIVFSTPRVFTPAVGDTLGGTIINFYSEGGEVKYGPSAALVWKNPDVARNELSSRFDWALKAKPYPGYALRHPVSPSPVGRPWPEHRHNGTAKTPIIYYPSEADTAEVGAVHLQLDENGYVVRFRKYRETIGRTFFFFGGYDRFYWRYEGPSIQEGE